MITITIETLGSNSVKTVTSHRGENPYAALERAMVKRFGASASFHKDSSAAAFHLHKHETVIGNVARPAAGGGTDLGERIRVSADGEWPAYSVNAWEGIENERIHDRELAKEIGRR